MPLYPPPPPNQQSEGFPLEFLLKGPQTELRTLSQNCEQTVQKLRTNRIVNKRAFLKNCCEFLGVRFRIAAFPRFRNRNVFGTLRCKPVEISENVWEALGGVTSQDVTPLALPFHELRGSWSDITLLPLQVSLLRLTGCVFFYLQLRSFYLRFVLFYLQWGNRK